MCCERGAFRDAPHRAIRAMPMRETVRVERFSHGTQEFLLLLCSLCFPILVWVRSVDVQTCRRAEVEKENLQRGIVLEKLSVDDG